MSKGIYNIALVPYDQHYILTVCVGLSMEEILDKFRINGDIYTDPPGTLKSFDTIKSEFDHFKIKDHLIKIQNGTTGGCVFYSDELDKDKTMFMFLPDFDWDGCTKKQLAKFMITIAHEVTHVAQFYLPKFLERNDEPEAECYFKDYVTECIAAAFASDLFH
jgi:hypothetical protein